MTFAGATALQLKSLMFGKDLQKQDLGFWIQAMQYGGGLSLAGDFMLADVNRFGQSPLESFLGPTYGLGKDLTETLILNPGRALRGEKTKFGRDAVNMVGRYTPLVSSLPYTRAAYRRMIDRSTHVPCRSRGAVSILAPSSRACSATPGSAISGRPERCCPSDPANNVDDGVPPPLTRCFAAAKAGRHGARHAQPRPCPRPPARPGRAIRLAQAPPPVPALPDAQRLTSYNLTASTCACSCRLPDLR